MVKQKSQLKAGLILNYINMFLGNLIPFFYTPVMLRLLGQDEYGLYKLSSTATSYLSLISLGIGSAVTRYLIKAGTQHSKEEEEKYFGLFMTIFRVISLISLLVGAVIVLLLPVLYGDSLTSEELNRMRIIVIILIVNMALNFAQSPYTSIVSAHEKFIFVQMMHIISTTILPIVNLIVLFMGYASIGMAASSLAVGILVRILYYLYVKKSMGYTPRYKNMPTNVLKEILIFSFWIFVANVVNQLYNTTDTMLIGMVPALGTAAVAVYNIGATFNNIVFSLATGLSNVLTPKANKMVFSNATNKELTDICIRCGRIQCYLIMLIVTGFIAFGQPFIRFYAGEGYGEAYWVALFIMIPSTVPLMQSMCLPIIVAQNRHKFRSLVYLGIAIINVAGTWFAMKKFGIIGAAAVSGIAYVLGQIIIMNWYYHTRAGLNMIRFWKELSQMFVIPIIMCAVALGVSRLVDFYNVKSFMAGVVIYTLIYCVLNWRFVMNKSEKGLILAPIKRVLKRG